MKKLFSLLLAIAVVVTLVGSASAALINDSRIRVETATLTNSGAVSTLSDGSTFSAANDVVIGFTAIGPGYAQVAMYDGDGTEDTTTTNLQAEAENVGPYAPNPTIWFEYPMTFTTGIYVLIQDSSAKGDNGIVIYVVKNWAKYSN